MSINGMPHFWRKPLSRFDTYEPTCDYYIPPVRTTGNHNVIVRGTEKVNLQSRVWYSNVSETEAFELAALLTKNMPTFYIFEVKEN